MQRFANKVAVVFGGGSGMGKATVARLISEGCRVAVADISGNEEAVAAAQGGNAVALHCDISIASDVERTIDATVQHFGALHVLINCTGICENPGALDEFDEAAFDKTVSVNFKGCLLAMKFGIPAIIRAGGGTVVSLASTAGQTAVVGAAAYTGSKAAVIAVTRAAALEYASRGVRVNCISPGLTRTPILLRQLAHQPDPEASLRILARENMLGRAAEPEELAAAIVFLASDDASFITGTTLTVDGGWTEFSSILYDDLSNSMNNAPPSR